MPPRDFTSQNARVPRAEACPQCLRPLPQCMCGKIEPLETRVRVVILQHPQERYKLWNSARLANLALSNSALRVGLSWPNLKKATGTEDAQPSRWAVLYLKKNLPPGEPFRLFNRKEEPLGDASFLEGIILLDGSWKQAHSMWWRNPWLLRLNRIALDIPRASWRNQAKAAGLATIESAAHALAHLGEPPTVRDALLRQYEDRILAPNRAKTREAVGRAPAPESG